MANWISDPLWDPQGRPYVTALADGPGIRKGEVRYIAPAEVSAQNAYGEDPRLRSWAQQHGAPGQSLLKNRGRWNATTGQWDQDVNWANIANMGVGAMIAAPLVAGAIGGGAPAAASTTAPGTSAFGTTSAALPAASQAALNTSPYVLGAVEPVATGGLTAAQTAAVAGGAGLSTAPYVSNLFSPDQPTQATTRSAGQGPQTGDDIVNGPGFPGTDANPITPNAFQLPLGLTTKDLIGYGSNFFNNYMANRTTSEYNEARAAADKAALDFAMRAYDEQQQKEQARFEATEARRVPYRRASLDTLAEFRRLLGLGE